MLTSIILDNWERRHVRRQASVKTRLVVSDEDMVNDEAATGHVLNVLFVSWILKPASARRGSRENEKLVTMEGASRFEIDEPGLVNPFSTTGFLFAFMESVFLSPEYLKCFRAELSLFSISLTQNGALCEISSRFWRSDSQIIEKSNGPSDQREEKVCGWRKFQTLKGENILLVEKGRGGYKIS